MGAYTEPDKCCCRYLGQLTGATDEADELLCKGIDILKHEVQVAVRLGFPSTLHQQS